MIVKEFKNFDQAWLKLNKMFLLENPTVQDQKAGPCSHSYNNIITIKENVCTLDYGLKCGYKFKKWNDLLRSYLDYERLVWTKEKIDHKVRKGNNNNNYAYGFKLRKGVNGSCLLGFMTRIHKQTRSRKGLIQIDFYVRVSEITRRGLVDLIFFHKIVDFLFWDLLEQGYELTCRLNYLTMYQSVMIAPTLHGYFDKWGVSKEGKKSKEKHQSEVENWYYRYVTEHDPIKRAMIELIKQIVWADINGTKRESFPCADLSLDVRENVKKK